MALGAVARRLEVGDGMNRRAGVCAGRVRWKDGNPQVRNRLCARDAAGQIETGRRRTLDKNAVGHFVEVSAMTRDHPCPRRRASYDS